MKTEETMKFLNQVAFYAVIVCKPKTNEFGFVDPFYIRFRKVQNYIFHLYVKFVTDSIP